MSAAISGWCSGCRSWIAVTGRGTIALHTVSSGRWSRQRVRCNGSAQPATHVQQWADERRTVLAARIAAHADVVAKIRAESADREDAADKQRDEAVAESAAIDAALAKLVKLAAKGGAA